MIFFTSDNHFFHKRVSELCQRPFQSLEEMHEVMIENWNSVVGPKDTVYHLGDLFLTNKLDQIDQILARLKGQIRILKGNHDRWLERLKRLNNAQNLIVEPELLEKKFHLSGKTYNVTMCHYPMLRWNKAHYGSINLHGHSHGGLDEYNKAQPLIRFDVGVDSNGFKPVSLEQILRFNREKIEKFQSGTEYDHHKEL